MAFEGILTVNKPTSMTSYDVIRTIKKIIGKNKIGHAGTLDPFATGILIIAIGRKFTKQLSSYQAMPKTYRFTIQLGTETSTLDPDGEIISESPISTPYTIQSIENTLNTFKGETKQTPPAFSAKKIQGQRAYKLARKGKEVKLEPTTITIHEINLLNYDPKTQQIECRINCKKGTYVRSLSRDIALQLNTVGYTKTLVREAVGNHTLDTALTIDQLENHLTRN